MLDYPNLNIQDLPADSRHSGGVRRHPIQFIIIHTTEGLDSRRWLTTDPSTTVSAHRLIRRGERIYKLLPDWSIAHTQGPAVVGRFGLPGYPGMNEVSLSIEVERLSKAGMAYPDELIRATAMQCVSWWSTHGILPVLYHWQIQRNKSDPPAWPVPLFQHMLLQELQRGFK